MSGTRFQRLAHVAASQGECGRHCGGTANVAGPASVTYICADFVFCFVLLFFGRGGGIFNIRGELITLFCSVLFFVSLVCFVVVVCGWLVGWLAGWLVGCCCLRGGGGGCFFFGGGGGEWGWIFSIRGELFTLFLQSDSDTEDFPPPPSPISDKKLMIASHHPPPPPPPPPPPHISSTVCSLLSALLEWLNFTTCWPNLSVLGLRF